MAMSRASALGALQRAAQQAEGDVLPDGQSVEQRSALEQHPEPGQKGLAVTPRIILSVEQDAAGSVGIHKPQDALQRH